jgi:hypothetical protein
MVFRVWVYHHDGARGEEAQLTWEEACGKSSTLTIKLSKCWVFIRDTEVRCNSPTEYR